MTIIKDMMNKIQTDHKEFLEHNEKMQEQMRYVQVGCTNVNKYGRGLY